MVQDVYLQSSWFSFSQSVAGNNRSFNLWSRGHKVWPLYRRNFDSWCQRGLFKWTAFHCVSIFWPLCNLVYSRPVNGAAINMHFSFSQDKFTSDFMETYFWTVERWELPKRDWCTCASLNFQHVFISHSSKNSSVNTEKKKKCFDLPANVESQHIGAVCACC